ncbi:MAG TPA: GNAT family N-acetyltransferase [Verrucomicrobiales bacterium]|jgi:phosphinothricin acetyltransferase|nr:GNAT family N-acetyltransferase [Verrucomicrobiales bacterium]
MTLRNATVADLPAINAIYNHYVPTSTCTFQITPETEESRQAWFSGRKPQHPVIVAELDGEVVAWGSLSPFHKREAYAGTVENSVYVHHERQRQGLGRKLMEELMRRARAEESLHTIIAIIAADQNGSVGLHRALGFKEIGLLKEVGRKFGRILDVVYMQYMLRE